MGCAPRHESIDQALRSAERTLLVLSPAFLQANFTQAQWTAAFSQDLSDPLPRLLPVRVQDGPTPGLLGALLPINLVGLDEEQARTCLLAGIRPGRARPTHAAFPGIPSKQMPFPGPTP